MTALIEVAGLAKSYGPIAAVADLGFKVEPGEIFGLVGPDGAGKTAVMRMLAGVLAPDRGRIGIAGVDVVAEPESVRPLLSYMPQRFGLYEDLTVDENIRFYADIFEIPRKLREERAAPLLAACGMTQFRRRRAGQLSGGMKQKLGLVCALVHTPKILLLDEPTTGVDPVSRRDLWRILYDLREQGVTILISTAYLDEAERCTRLGLLHQGRLRYCDTPRRLKALMPGQMIEIASDQPRQIRDRLAALPGVKGTLMVGDGVRVLVDDSAVRLPELRAALPGSRPEPVEPTIEDLFVALLGDAQAPS